MSTQHVDFDFSGRVVLITGAATGIGRATALAFARSGAMLSIGDINEDAAADTLGLVRDIGAQVLFTRTDVSDERDVERLTIPSAAFSIAAAFLRHRPGSRCGWSSHGEGHGSDSGHDGVRFSSHRSGTRHRVATLERLSGGGDD